MIKEIAEKNSDKLRGFSINLKVVMNKSAVL